MLRQEVPSEKSEMQQERDTETQGRALLSVSAFKQMQLEWGLEREFQVNAALNQSYNLHHLLWLLLRWVSLITACSLVFSSCSGVSSKVILARCHHNREGIWQCRIKTEVMPTPCQPYPLMKNSSGLVRCEPLDKQLSVPSLS